MSSRILNACYLVRYYARPGTRAARRRAIAELGRIVKEELARDDTEAVAVALVLGLSADLNAPGWAAALEDLEPRRLRRR